MQVSPLLRIYFIYGIQVRQHILLYIMFLFSKLQTTLAAFQFCSHVHNLLDIKHYPGHSTERQWGMTYVITSGWMRVTKERLHSELH